MIKFCIFHLRQKKNYLFRHKWMVLVFCVALVMLILCSNICFLQYSSAGENVKYLINGDDRYFPGNNSPIRSSTGNVEPNNPEHNFLRSPFTISNDELLHNNSKPVSHEKIFPPVSAMRSKESFLKWLSIQPVPPYQVRYFLNQPQLCPNKGANDSLLMALTSAVDHEEARSVIRETWGGYAKERGSKLLYFVGVPEQSELNEKLIMENEKFQDIIQSNFLDTYKNLTLKTISMLKWISEFCSEVKYVLKVDDDMFLNPQGFLNLTSGTNVSKTIMGHILRGRTPFRSNSSKWYVPYSAYPFNKYPDFASGTAYLISGDSVKLLCDAAVKIINATPLSFYKNEDVCVTGFAAELTGIKRINLAGVYTSAQKIHSCNFQHLLSSHRHSPQDIRKRWLSLKKSNFTCSQ